jgi:hypothetical protein
VVVAVVAVFYNLQPLYHQELHTQLPLVEEETPVPMTVAVQLQIEAQAESTHSLVLLQQL